MADEQAARALVSLSSGHVNLTSPVGDTSGDVKEVRRFVRRDEMRIQFARANGMLLPIKWRKQLRPEVKKHLNRFVHRYTSVRFHNVEKDGVLRFRDEDFSTAHLDLLVIHNNCMVLLAIPSKEVCSFAYEEATRALEICVPDPTSAIREKICQSSGDGNSPQSWLKHSVSFGVSFRPQKPANKSNVCRSRNAAVSCTRFGHYINPAQHSGTSQCVGTCLSSCVRPFYQSHLLPVFKKSGRKFGARGSYPKHRLGHKFDATAKFVIPAPMNSSIPARTDIAGVALATFENQLRSVAEWMLMNFFLPLPYATIPHVVARNIRNAAVMLEARGENTPLRSLGRAFPKGTIVMTRDGKPLHDDENGAVSPSIWTNVDDCPSTVIEFRGTQFNVSVSCTKNRFLWFMGFVPHLTYQTCEDEPGSSAVLGRIAHSAYTKPESEHLGLSTFTFPLKNRPSEG